MQSFQTVQSIKDVSKPSLQLDLFSEAYRRPARQNASKWPGSRHLISRVDFLATGLSTIAFSTCWPRSMGKPLCLRGPVYSEHQSIYEAYLAQDWTPTDRARVDDLIVYQDFYWGIHQNSLEARHHEVVESKGQGSPAIRRCSVSLCI